MTLMIKTVDNFQGENNSDERDIKIKENYYFSANKSDIKPIYVTLQDYLPQKNSFFSFSDKKVDDDLIISISKIDNKFFVKTGNFVGKFRWNGIDIEINSRFGKNFLKRMLNFSNDVFLNDVDIAGKENKKNKDLDVSRFIIYYLFLQKLEKAFLLGLPRAYQTKKYHEINVRGNVDINRFIKNDIPFKGKISSSKRELLEIQEIIDVLYEAIRIVQKDEFDTKFISNVVTHLKQNRSNKFVSSNIIKKALNSKALNNPIYFPYKSILEYAQIIIENKNIENKNGKIETRGFIVNIAELFEIYVRKLLSKYFPDWIIESPKIELYNDNFFSRKIIPDIVMKKDNKVLVFDTKYKRMNFNGKNNYGLGDVDRNDFFQINTYMSYYNNQGYELIAGGLLYPLEKEYDKEKCFSNHWFGNEKVKFVIDGIEITNNIKEENYEEFVKLIKQKEKEFINRVENLITTQ